MLQFNWDFGLKHCHMIFQDPNGRLSIRQALVEIIEDVRNLSQRGVIADGQLLYCIMCLSTIHDLTIAYTRVECNRKTTEEKLSRSLSA